MILHALLLALQMPSSPRLVLETEAGEIYIASVDGKSVMKLTDGQRPVWSPAGMRVAFGVPSGLPANSETGAVDLFVINADGTARRRIATQVQAEGYEWKWTPDSKSLMFVKRATTDFDQAWMVSLEGSARKLGPVCAGEFDYALISSRNQILVWRAVGKWTPDDLDDPKHHHEYVRSGDSKSLGEGVDAQFSPDAKWVAYDRDGKLMIATGDGAKLRARGRLEADEAGYTSFHWLPDSSGIVFVEGGTRDVVVMRPDGTGKRRLAGKSDSVWVSPAGSRALAFTDSGWILADVATGKSTRIYDDIDFVPIAWSNDGSRIYFSSFTDAGTIVRWYDSSGKLGGQFNAKKATFDTDPLSPRGNVLVGSGEKGLTLFQSDGAPVTILADQRVMRYAWSSK